MSLPEELVRKAKVYAAEHDKTINAVVRELLEDALSRESRARKAARCLLDLAEQAPYSDLDPGSITRDDLHER